MAGYKSREEARDIGRILRILCVYGEAYLM